MRGSSWVWSCHCLIKARILQLIVYLPKIQTQDLYQGKALKVSDCLLKEFPGIMLLSQYDSTQNKLNLAFSAYRETQFLHTLSLRAYKLVGY